MSDCHKKNRTYQTVEEIYEKYGKEKVDFVLSRFPEGYAKVFNLFYGVEDGTRRSAKEISEITGYSKNSVGVLLGRIRNRLDTDYMNFNYKKKSNNDDRDTNKELLKQYKLYGDKEAYKALFEANIKLIRYIMTFYYGKENDHYKNEEIFSAGCLGLLSSIEKFDMDLIDKVSFSTFASTGIRNEIAKFVSKERKYNKIISIDEIENKATNNLQRIIDNDYKKYKAKKIQEALNTLNEKEKMIMEHYYGLNGKEKMTSFEISEKLGISRQTIMNIVERVKKYLSINLKEFKNQYTFDNREEFDKDFEQHNNIDVKIALDSLDEKTKKIMLLYYGLDDNYEGVKYLENDEETMKLIKTTMRKLKEKLENLKAERLKRKKKLYNLVNCNDEKLINEIINNLPKEKSKKLKIYFSLDDSVVMNETEICKILNTKSIYLKQDIKLIIDEINKIIKNKKNM